MVAVRVELPLLQDITTSLRHKETSSQILSFVTPIGRIEDGMTGYNHLARERYHFDMYQGLARKGGTIDVIR